MISEAKHLLPRIYSLRYTYFSSKVLLTVRLREHRPINHLSERSIEKRNNLPNKMALQTLSAVLKTPLKNPNFAAFAAPSILNRTTPQTTQNRLMCNAAPRYPRVLIEYCPGCRWGLRAGWIAQELLVTFETNLGEVAVRPSRTSGVFDVWVGDIRVFCRSDMGRFPELREVKRAVRDIVQPERDLGHSDL